MKHSNTPPALFHLEEQLAVLASNHLLRQRSRRSNEKLFSFASNDYLGLASTLAHSSKRGAGASRLISSEQEELFLLENTLSHWLGVEDMLVFTSGYSAQLGTLSALATQEDLIVSDALIHASAIDGARLSKARIAVVPHLDREAIEHHLRHRCEKRAWVITESYFSMDADSPDLASLRKLCNAYGAALLVDEAHAIGVLGPEGKGLCAQANIRPDVLIGGFGKAFGNSGGFAAGCSTLIKWLWNKARSFVFSTGMSPCTATNILEAFRTFTNRPFLREKVLANATLFRAGLKRLELDVRGYGPIIPWVVGSSERALALAQHLSSKGIYVVAIRPPTVPPGTSRLRFTVTANHSENDLEWALRCIKESLACQLR
ncbi:aminotransferase class I/II-fold pyridoxal phosphate-dependent enzyme [Pajaroellobacter abortibovis]|uniref:Aminotransferase class I/classII large domain-containing protein n=1 Tax=Pajaroellobacter abortibovis TaxID=1882918 RepID=A0A1L6MUN9_9BACT|nr:8-amino-7-oxononanoate synthase [Pajaroellobacter abortibovis]APR99239.1 hypothetical protein BCY86_00040 [Pajaroellobacter abortibovis]